MALEWSVIDIPFGGGLESKAHPFLREAPKLDALVNLRFIKSGALSSRNGMIEVGTPRNHAPDAFLTWGNTIAHIGRDGAHLLDREEAGAWRALPFSTVRSVDVVQRPVLRTQEGSTLGASAVNNGHVLHAWSHDDVLWVKIVNATTGVVVYGPTGAAGLEVDAPWERSLRAIAHENEYVTVFAHSVTGPGVSVASVTYRVLADGTVSVGPTSVLASTNAENYDVHANRDNSQAYLVSGQVPTDGTMTLVRLVRFGTQLVAESSCTLINHDTFPFARCSVLHHAPGTIVAVAAASLDGGYALWTRPAAATLSGSHTWVSEVLPALPADVNASFRPSLASRSVGFVALFEGSTDQSPFDLNATPRGNISAISAPIGVKRLEYQDGGALLAARETTWNVTLGCRPIEVDGELVIPLVAYDTLSDERAQVGQPRIIDPGDDYLWPYGGNTGTGPIDPLSQYIWRRAWSSRRMGWVATCLPTVDGLTRMGVFGNDFVTYRIDNRIANAYEIDGRAIVVMPTVDAEERANLGPLFLGVVNLREFSFRLRRHVSTGAAQGSALVAGGYLANIDGDRVSEVMQIAPPSFVDVIREVPGSNPAAGAELGVGSAVRWRAIWEWRDALGVLHRSAPGEIGVGSTEGFAVDSAHRWPAEFSCRIAIPPFIDAEIKQGALPKDIYLRFYISPSDWSLPATPVPDDVYVEQTGLRIALEAARSIYPWMTTRITINPSRVVTLEQNDLYTNGGVLPNDPIINPLSMATTLNRVWVIDSEDRYSAWFSKPISGPGMAPEFSAALTLRVPAESGELVALGAIDDLVVLLSERSIHALDTADAGPDSLGEGDWPPLRRISREVGCANAASVVTTDVGLFFASEAGIYLLSATGDLRWVGQDLGDDFDVYAIRSASVLPTRKEVVFTTPQATVSYDYLHGQWTAFSFGGSSGPTTGTQIARSTPWNGEVFLASNNGTAWREDVANNERVSTLLRTGWMHLAGLQGFQRVRRVSWLGRITFLEPDAATPPDPICESQVHVMFVGATFVDGAWVYQFSIYTSETNFLGWTATGLGEVISYTAGSPTPSTMLVRGGAVIDPEFVEGYDYFLEICPPAPVPEPCARGTLLMRAFYDYDASDFQDYEIDLDTVSESLDPMRLRIHLERQRCQSLMLQLSYLPAQENACPGRPEIAGLALEVGTKGRLKPWAHMLGATGVTLPRE